MMSRKGRNNNQKKLKLKKRTAPPKEQPKSVPEYIMVQRLSENLWGRLKKLEPRE